MSAPATAPPRRAFIKSWGCQMNAYDSERMGAALARLGYRTATAPQDAELILLNTCHIREKAAEKLYSELGRLVRLKRARPDLVIGVAGCVAQAEGEEIVRRVPQVDMVFGPQALPHLPQLLRRLAARRARGETKSLVEMDLSAPAKFDWLDRLAEQSSGARSPSAFLTIQEGCDKFCTFCVVPYTRGGEVSRPLNKIVDEARALLARGVCEITLLGQNVNGWHAGGKRFSDLLHALAGLAGLARLRFTTSHPRDMDDGLVDAFRDLPVLMPYLHLPIQSGSDRVLAAMNRRHTVAFYLERIDALRRARADMAFSTDFIVGFPGESEKDFAATLALARRMRFARAYAFQYSPRPGTPAATRPQLTAPCKADRLHRLQAVLAEHEQAFHARMVGTVQPVLFDAAAQGDRQGDSMRGRNPWLTPVHVPRAAAALGRMRAVRITHAGGHSLQGRLAAGAAGRARPQIPDASPPPLPRMKRKLALGKNPAHSDAL